ncbi:MAG: hypothetical protein ACI8UO_005200 [Verrucomicrobiales bacterium]|jgi:hypothetical protein
MGQRLIALLTLLLIGAVVPQLAGERLACDPPSIEVENFEDDSSSEPLAHSPFHEAWHSRSAASFQPALRQIPAGSPRTAAAWTGVFLI